MISRFRTFILAVVLLFGAGQQAMADKGPKAGSIVSEGELSRCGAESFFSSSVISDSVFAVMQGRSMPEGCTVGRASLRYLRVLHRNLNGEAQVGELVCNKAIAADLLEIFRQLYEKGYPIERMMLIDNYGADDERSMTANNSSSFCYRTVRGTNKVSAHGRGMAVDINPLYNPCVKQRKGKTVVEPEAGRKYANRNLSQKANPQMITRSSFVYKLFKKYGFTWGGDWRSLKDYQHFEK